MGSTKRISFFCAALLGGLSFGCQSENTEATHGADCTQSSTSGGGTPGSGGSSSTTGGGTPGSGGSSSTSGGDTSGSGGSSSTTGGETSGSGGSSSTTGGETSGSGGSSSTTGGETSGSGGSSGTTGGETSGSGGSSSTTGGETSGGGATGGGDGGTGGSGGTGGTGGGGAGCVHPSPAVLTAVAISAADIVFDADCRAYVPTIQGYDWVNVIDSSGAVVEVLTGYSDYNIPAVAIDPTSGIAVVGHNNNSDSAVGKQVGAAIEYLATGSYVSGSSWADYYMNQCASSIAVDAAGCVWTPNFAGNGSLVCVDLATGDQTTVAADLGGRIEGIAVDGGGRVLVSIGPSILEVDTMTGSGTPIFTALSTIFDFAVGPDGDLYVHVAGEVLRVPAGSGVPVSFAAVTGEGKLAISPDGYLVRMVPTPSGNAPFEEWKLD